MKFSNIMYKNIRYNIRKYLSSYFVNSFIVAVIFMYGSLLFNKIIIEKSGIPEQMGYTIKTVFICIALFSVVFMTYTNIYFLKCRGKEFGLYLTLGMTTRDLFKIILLENSIITMSSLITGLATGLLFSRIFYMLITRILSLSSNIYNLSYKTFLLSAAVFVIILILNLIFIKLYLRKLAIVDLIKSSSKKEVSKSKPIIGLLALVLLLIAAYVIPQTLLRKILNGNSKVVIAGLAATMICPYFIIGSIIELIKLGFKKFPNLYNKNLFVLADLSHRFFSYKVVLYSVSLLVAGSIFFVGLSYSFYAMVHKNIDKTFPYDFMLFQTSKWKNLSENKVKEIIENNGGVIEKLSTLKSIELPEYREEGGKVTSWGSVDVISESNYNNHMNSKIDVQPNSIINVAVTDEKIKRDAYTTVLTLDGDEKAKKRESIFTGRNDASSSAEFYRTTDNNKIFKVSNSRTKFIFTPYIDEVYNNLIYTYGAIIVDDSDYKHMSEEAAPKAHTQYMLIKLKSGDSHKILKSLQKQFRLDNDGSKKYIDSLISKQHKLEEQIHSYGFILFSMIFLGALFLISSAVVLYYKIVADLEEEKVKMNKIKCVGITYNEGQKILAKQLGIIFLTPFAVGGMLGLYYIYVCFSNLIMLSFYLQKALIVIGIYGLIQLIFYLNMRHKYFNEIL